MNIIIPLCGKGERFKKEGYNHKYILIKYINLIYIIFICFEKN